MTMVTSSSVKLSATDIVTATATPDDVTMYDSWRPGGGDWYQSLASCCMNKGLLNDSDRISCGVWYRTGIRLGLGSVRHGSQVVTNYATAAGDPGSNPALGKHGHCDVTTRSPSPRRPTPTPPDANLRYQDALDWRKWTKGGWDFPFCPRSFGKAVMAAGPGREIRSKVMTCRDLRPYGACGVYFVSSEACFAPWLLFKTQMLPVLTTAH